MHPSLRPELRGAQRILRAIRLSPSASSHRVIRSFSQFQRLQSESSKPDDSSNPDKQPSGGDKNIFDIFQERLDFLKSHGSNGGTVTDGNREGNAVHSVFAQGSDSKPSDLSGLPSDFKGKFRESAKNNEEKIEKLQESIQRGEIPPGYKIVKDVKDLPTAVTQYLPDGPFPSFPFLFNENVSFPRVVPLPKDFKERSRSAISGDKTSTAPSTHPSTDTTPPANTVYYGSVNARRKRARDNKPAPQPSEQVPSWFLSNNIILSESDAEHRLGVLPVQQSKAGVYEPVTAALAQAEVTQSTPGQTPPAETDPLEHAHGSGGEQPTPDGGSPTPVKPVPTHDVQNHVTLSDSRYFVEQHQYQELLDTFRGRLQTPASDSKLSDSPLALNHLTITHCAKDADTLLDTLVSDLCHKSGADRIRLDAQDISDLIAAADLDHNVAHKGSRLSFSIYKDMFAPANPYEEDMFSREEDEDDMNDEDDTSPPGASFGIGITGPSSGRFSKNIYDRLTKSLNLSRGGPVIELFGAGHSSPKSSVGSTGIFGSLVESILSSHVHARSQKGTQSDEASEKSQPTDVRPLVLHLPNYRALQDHSLSEAFMNDVLYYVGRSSAKIMVVGTDCAREDSSQKSMLKDPRYILEEQNSKSFGLSSNILLTPVFPDVTAELALLKDRENRIRNINARHLWRVLQAKGVPLHNLDAGFWSKDYSAQVGEADWKELADRFWPFLQVQRVAALISGESSSESPSSSPISNALTTMKLSDQSKQEWASRNQPVIQTVAEKESEQPTNKTIAKIRAKATRHEKKLLSGVIEPKKIATTFKDIHIPAETIEALQTLTTLSLVRPEAFRYGVLKSDRIPGLLLYGPPGTGKTLAAKAVAKESGATMLEVSAADLNDMYVGEGEKNVQALFSLAKKLSPCVVFLDEADAMFSARSAQGRRVSHRELLNQFLKEWDGMSNDSGSAFIMVATNRPMDLDDAVLRRLPRRILVDLPTESDRLEILKIHLRQESLSDEVNLPDLAKKTPFYSGSDLKNVAVAAALNAVREENEAAKQYRLNNPDSEVPYTYPVKRTLTSKHFEKALEEISASISEDMSSLKEIKKFDEQFGDRKGRKRKSPRWGFKSANEADKVLETVKVRS